MNLGDVVMVKVSAQSSVTGKVGALSGLDGECIVRYPSGNVSGWIPQDRCSVLRPAVTEPEAPEEI